MNREHSEIGHRVVTAGSLANVQAYGFLVLADAVVSTVTYEDGYDASATSLNGLTLPAGLYFPARFTGLTVASGTVCVMLSKSTLTDL